LPYTSLLPWTYRAQRALPVMSTANTGEANTPSTGRIPAPMHSEHAMATGLRTHRARHGIIEASTANTGGTVYMNALRARNGTPTESTPSTLPHRRCDYSEHKASVLDGTTASTKPASRLTLTREHDEHETGVLHASRHQFKRRRKSGVHDREAMHTSA